MRIGVRARCQRQGIGRKLIEYCFEHYPAHFGLDVSTDNANAINFYHRIGLQLERKYITEEEKVEFACFTTPEDFVYVPYVRQQVTTDQAAASETMTEEQKHANSEEIKLTEANKISVLEAIDVELEKKPASETTSPLLLHEQKTDSSSKDGGDKICAANNNSDEETGSSSSETVNTT